MRISIDETADHPPYEQLRRQVIELIGTGELSPGDKLPPVRQLATELGLAANTVARSYRELEAEGYVITRGRAGTMVAHEAKSAADVATQVDHATTEYVTLMRSLGLSSEHITAAINRAL